MVFVFASLPRRKIRLTKVAIQISHASDANTINKLLLTDFFGGFEAFKHLYLAFPVRRRAISDTSEF